MRHVSTHIFAFLAMLAGAMIVVHLLAGVHFPLAPLGISLLLLAGGTYVVLHDRDVRNDSQQRGRR